MIQRALVLAYAVIAYGVGLLATLLYTILFVGDFRIVPKTINSGTPGELPGALVVDIALIVLFGLQHTGMARTGFKRWWTRVIPSATERSTYLVATGVMLPLLFILWRPIPTTLWDLRGTPVAPLLDVLYLAGWCIAIGSSFMIHHGELFGLQQALDHFLGRDPRELAFRTPLIYRVVRHPIYAGMVMAFWMASHMTVGRLVFATSMTVYAMIGAAHEERDLVARFGDRYVEYRHRVGGLVPRLARRRRTRNAGGSTIAAHADG